MSNKSYLVVILVEREYFREKRMRNKHEFTIVFSLFLLLASFLLSILITNTRCENF